MFAIVLQDINLLFLITIPQLIISDSYNMKYINWILNSDWLLPLAVEGITISLRPFSKLVELEPIEIWNTVVRGSILGESVFLQHVVALVIL